ncbi:MAG: PQQ-binding-like beta-propeller repeat protein, partial [Gemmataceae bacterium]|nr:PQQ-binding-like beta-propeller repeat protein [Gemmataceae bacterium]
MVRCLLAPALFWLWLGLAVTLAWPAPANEALPRVGLPGEEPRTARRLAGADKRAAQQQWAEAIDEYQRILSEAGDDLVPLDPRHSLQARQLCHLRLAALPPAALRLYRARVDAQAKKWLDQGTAQRDSAVLRRLVEEAFCSRFTDQALDLLGDLAFERGDFEEANHWWRLLALPASELAARPQPESAKAKLLFPDPKVDLARVRAKQILVRLFRGECDGLGDELQAFRGLHAAAKGELAGRKGSYADLLTALAGQRDTLASPRSEESWPTFAGAGSRQRVLTRAPGRLGQLRPLEEPNWCVHLESGRTLYGPETREVDLGGSPLPLPGKSVLGLEQARALAYHPVIASNQVLVADARSVTAYQLNTGRRLLRYELWTTGRWRGPEIALKAEDTLDVSYPLTVADDHVYARLGIQALGPLSKKELNSGNSSRSVLVCLPLQPAAEKFSERWDARWVIRPKVEDGTPAEFEGAPVVHHGRVYSAVTRFVGGQTQTALACYDAQNGLLRWQRSLCVTQELKEGEQRTRHHLLTLAGPQIVYCAHAGALIALDAATGRHAWAVRYPSRDARTVDSEPLPRGLAPALYAGGRLFVAPADGDRVLCLDAANGYRLWESSPLEVLHLLGVAKGRLIFTFTTAPVQGIVRHSGIRALDAARGTDEGGWLQPSDGSSFPTFGRGFLAGDWVFWPTSAGLRILNQEDGEAAVLLGLNEVRGNLVAGNGCLLVAGVQHLWGYVPPASLLEQRRRAARLSEVASAAHYHLALAEADAGLNTQALATLIQVEREASAEEQGRRGPLRDQARERRYQLLRDWAEEAVTQQHWDEAAGLLAQAAGTEFSLAARAQALARQAALWAQAGQPDRALKSWQTILGDAELRTGTMPDPAGIPRPGAELARLQIEELIRAHGRALYRPIEQQARALLGSVKEDNQEEVLTRLLDQYPNASATGTVLLRLALLYERSGRDGAAAKAYRTFLQRARAGQDQARTLVGLARAYERQACWQAARNTWQRLEETYGERTLAAVDPRRSVRAWVARQLLKPEYRAAAEALPGAAAGPVTRTWSTSPISTTRAAPERLLVPEECSGSSLPAEYLVSAAGSRILCREVSTGKLRWERVCSAPPSWIGQHADAVLVAEAHRIRSLRLADGEPLWKCDLRPECLDPQSRLPSLEETTLSAFQLAGSRLFFLQGQCRFFAVAADHGQVLWTCWAPAARLRPPAPAGRFHSRYHASANWLVVQTSGGERWILDSQTGRKLHEAPTSSEPWPRAPLALDEHRICLIPDARQIVLFDGTTGKEIWTYALHRQRWPSLSGEAPQILGAKNTLLVLLALNYGYELEALDLRTGKPLWPGRRLVSRSPVDFATGAIDEGGVYFVSRGVLSARNLSDGSLRWQL